MRGQETLGEIRWYINCFERKRRKKDLSCNGENGVQTKDVMQ